MLALYLYGRKYPKFSKTMDIPIDKFLGTYIQISYTPNWFQSSPYATATYSNTETDGLFSLKNIQWEYKNEELVEKKSITGTFRKVDEGTFKIKFKNVPVKGLYRILDYEINDLGTFVIVSSYSPKTSWLLWKPPTSQFDLEKAYDYAMEKNKFFKEIGINKLIIADKSVVEKIVNKLNS